MKKCASCTKDLPEAALHCVFCGAKQPPAPAVQPGLAKTAFGYSNEQLQQLKNQAPQAPSPGPYVPPPQQPYNPPQQQQPYNPPQQQQPYNPPPQRPHPPSNPPYGGGMAPTAPANAATVFVQGGPPAQPQQAAYMQTAVSPHGPSPYPQPVPQPMAPPRQQPGMGVHGPQHGYSPIPQAGSPYMGQHSARAGRPIEPWKDALPLLMIVWGIATLVAFATPQTTGPMTFSWDVLGDAPGKLKLMILLPAVIGLLGAVLGALPMMPMPRGILATLLGVSVVITPIAIMGELPPWQMLLMLVGILLILPGLLLRNEYVESAMPRIMVTLGVVLVLAPLLVPDHGEIPLIGMFKELVNGHIHGTSLVMIAMVLLAVLCLLVWLPAPSTAGAKIFAWLWMLAPAALTVFALVDAGSHAPDLIKAAPGQLVAWVPMSTCAIFIGYGLATVLGKQLE
ncbi:MAG: hypothetical protein ABI678_19255 [Kofleriaceae bacterium]